LNVFLQDESVFYTDSVRQNAENSKRNDERKKKIVELSELVVCKIASQDSINAGLSMKELLKVCSD